ncbi:hypothetical protein GCM10009552_09000 [Rothia nasimurium]|uniref:Alpha/beta hydrolase n=1 Tax=Luteibacter anthropi TaxID=564369 RepID=A0A7X5U6Q4_9GAMM|nr:alpha/beta hydrolase [Luteibacter anthropi]NII04842.1 alpha/beta hydrolase [Luteibacter anthropi]
MDRIVPSVFRHAWLPLLALAASQDAGATPVAWTPSATPGVDCTSLSVPLDYHGDTAETRQIEVCRMRPAEPAHRRGVMLLVPGESDLTPAQALSQQVERWRQSTLDDWKALARTFDVVTVAPRGLTPGADNACLSAADEGGLATYRRFGIDTSAANLDAAANRAVLLAFTCSGDSMAPYAGIRQRLGDIESLRSRLGEDFGAIYATGQGAWVVARYLAVHPGAMSPVVLDSPVDFTATRWGATLSGLMARGALYRNALSLVDASIDATAGFARLPAWFRVLVDDHIAEPRVLKNALEVGRCMASASPELRPYCAKGYGPVGADFLPDATFRLIASDSPSDQENLSGSGRKPTSQAHTRDVIARACVDDDSYRAPLGLWKQRIVGLDREAPLAQYGEGFVGMVCSHWLRNVAPTPVHPDAGNTPVLALRKEGDTAAMHTDIVKAMASTRHGTLVMSKDPVMHDACAAHLARAFLIDGHRPATPLVNCAAE